MLVMALTALMLGLAAAWRLRDDVLRSSHQGWLPQLLVGFALAQLMLWTLPLSWLAFRHGDWLLHHWVAVQRVPSAVFMALLCLPQLLCFMAFALGLFLAYRKRPRLLIVGMGMLTAVLGGTVLALLPRLLAVGVRADFVLGLSTPHLGFLGTVFGLFLALVAGEAWVVHYLRRALASLV